METFSERQVDDDRRVRVVKEQEQIRSPALSVKVPSCWSIPLSVTVHNSAQLRHEVEKTQREREKHYGYL